MLLLESQDVVGQTAYWADDTNPLQYYALPGEPTLAVRNGKPVFKYVKYRSPIDRPGGVKAGGFVVMQAELAIPKKDEEEIRRRISERGIVRTTSRMITRPDGSVERSSSVTRENINPDQIKIGRPLITRGKATISVLDRSTGDAGGDANSLVQRISVPTPPSLFGNNSVSIGIELSELGAPIFEAAMKGEGASMVIVGYELGYQAKLPKAHIVGTWEASSLMEFSQEIDEDTRWYAEDDYEEKISEFIKKSETQKIEWLTSPSVAGMEASAQQKMVEMIEDSIRKQLDEGIKRNVLEAIPQESRDVTKLQDKGFDDIKRTVNVERLADVRVEYKAAKVIEMPANPNAPLPAFKSIMVDGKAQKWEDYAITVDGDDPFFKQLAANFLVNADFEDLPLASVIVQVSYKGATGTGRSETYTFRKPDDQERFEAFLDGGTGEFDYSYVVNYKGESNTYKSPPLKSKSDVSINVGDLGIWKVDIDVGDVNFEQVEQVQLKLRYDDGDIHAEKQFTVTADARQHQVREVIFKPRNNAWTYEAKYFLKGGREIVVPATSADGEQLYVNDPFSATRNVSIRTKGDFETVIDTLFLDFVYVDDANDYRQEKSFAFSAAGKRFEDWSFPVISDKSGTLTYTGNIVYKDGRTPTVIAEKTVTSNTVLEGEDVLKLAVELIPDLLDWNLMKLVTVTLGYSDPANGVEETDTFTLRKDAAPQTWTVNIKDRARKSYTVAPRFFMADGTKKEPTAFEATDEVLVLELPA